MSDRTKPALALACTVLLAVLAWRSGFMRAPPSASARSPKSDFTAPWKTEQEWLVDFIVRDLAGIATYAATGRAPKAGDLKLQVSQIAPAVIHVDASLALADGKAPRTVQDDIRLEPYLWSPEPYLGIARTFLGPESPPAAGPGATEEAGDRLLGSLMEPFPSTLLRENQGISRRLQAKPMDVAAHEDAALLIGAFALRDAAGYFQDSRLAFSRITAHLTLSRTLRGASEPGLTSRYAETVLLSLVERQADALARLKELERGAGGSAEQAAWIRALRLRNTADWRITAEAPRLTLLEKREEFNATLAMIKSGAAVGRLDRRGAEAVADWSRMITRSGGTVEIGQRFGSEALLRETEELQQGAASLRGARLEENAWAQALDAPPGGLVSQDAAGRPAVMVLDWGAWASSGQRHILNHAHNYTRFVGHSLYLKDKGRDLARSFREEFGGLILYPVVLQGQAEDAAAYASAMKAVRDLATKHPERIPGGCWDLIHRKPEFAGLPGDLPDENSWLQPSLPSGTVYDLTYRARLQDLSRASADDWKRLRVLAPYFFDLVYYDVERNGGLKRSPEALAEAFDPFADYNFWVAGFMANAAWSDLAKFEPLQRKLCAMVPESCFVLGNRLAQAGQGERAAAAYQEGIDRSSDHVAAAGNSRWLVDYYFDHGQKARALDLAKSAAEAYSSDGLFVMARLMERMGQLTDAELYYGRMLERYDDKGMLLGFFYRQARVAKNPDYERRLEKLLPEVFPGGLEAIDRSKLPSPPRDGALIKEENNNTLPYNIKKGNVVVGLDGFRVHTFAQYDAVRAFSQSPDMTLLVWRGHDYDEVKVSLYDRRFGIDMATFAPDGGTEADTCPFRTDTRTERGPPSGWTWLKLLSLPEGGS